jgi:predicted nucleic acid-binding protein
MIVADASALVHAVSSVSGREVLTTLSQQDVHCPAHVDAEIGQALRRATLSRPALQIATLSALHQAAQLVDTRRDIPGALTSLAWTLRERVSFYDALYVALAVVLDVPLLTADARLSRADLPCRVELVNG